MSTQDAHRACHALLDYSEWHLSRPQHYVVVCTCVYMWIHCPCRLSTCRKLITCNPPATPVSRIHLSSSGSLERALNSKTCMKQRPFRPKNRTVANQYYPLLMPCYLRTPHASDRSARRISMHGHDRSRHEAHCCIDEHDGCCQQPSTLCPPWRDLQECSACAYQNRRLLIKEG